MTNPIRTVLAVSLFSLALLSPRDGHAKVTRINLANGGDFGSSVAVGPDGTAHVFYLSRSRHLHHAWLSGGRRYEETVDTLSEAVYGNASAVDSQGRIHVAYTSDRSGLGGGGVLSYAVRDAAGWTITDMGPGSQSTAIAIGAGDLPRILQGDVGGYPRYSSFNGATWDLVDLGTPAHGFMGTSLVLDASGHAHATFGLNTQQYYGTDATGSWVVTPLGSGGAHAGVALDAQGHPHVLAAYNSGVAVPSLRHLWDTGAGWQETVIFDSTTGAIPDRVALTSDGKGGLFGLFSITVNAYGRSVEFAFATFFNGFEWLAKPIGRNAGFEVAVARGPDGSYHGTHRDPVGGDDSRVVYSRVRLPDLVATWDAVEVVPLASARQLEGTLRLRNAGPAPAKPVRISFFLSSDDVLDPGDERLDADIRVGSTRPGKDRIVPVSLGPVIAVPGTRVLVVVDADGRVPDTNRLDNALPVLLYP